MGFLERRQSKRNKTPDLSRYSQYQSPSSRNGSLSTNAASSALRTYSLTNNPTSNHGGFGGYERSNSLSGYDRSNSFSSFNSFSQGRSNSINSRSNSLMSNNPRMNSMGSNSLRSNQGTRTGEPQIIIHTTRTMDEHGRLKSITTETIRKYGSFELVKTETKPMNNNQPSPRRSLGLSPPPMIKYANSLTSQELESIAEEEEIHPYKRLIINDKAKEEVVDENDDDDDESGDTGNNYSDGEKITENIGSGASSVRKRVSIEDIKSHDNHSINTNSGGYNDWFRKDGYQFGAEHHNKKSVSADEMYERAYEVAMKKVYGDNNRRTTTTTTPVFKSHSLRTSSLPTTIPTTHTNEPPSKPKTGLFKKLSKVFRKKQ
ncbi:unnamed protein product [Wickerhamomyces anomalus]